MTDTLTLALAQIEINPGDVAGNLDRGLDAIERAKRGGADLVALPEIFTTGYFAFDAYAATAEPLDGETISRIQSAAREHDIAILAGTIVEDLEASATSGFETPDTSGYANTAVFVDPDGTVRSVYRKHHLFGYGSREADLLIPGESIDVVEFGGHVIATTTCYDLRFPELYRRLVDRGATLVLVPSAWPYPRLEHWSVLPRARAIENLCYVAAGNGVGSFENAQLLGRSTVYDPWGTTIAGLDDEPGMLFAPVDPETVERRRAEFPALEDRRADL